MPIKYHDKTIEMTGSCSVEECDELLVFLDENPDASVSMQECEHLHTALLQVLLARRVPLVGDVYAPFLWKWVAPLLRPNGGL